MTLEQARGMNVAQIIEFYGTDPRIRHRTFLMYRDEEEELKEVDYATFYDMSMRYGAMIQQIRKEKGKLDAPRFHVAFLMQNTPEVVIIEERLAQSREEVFSPVPLDDNGTGVIIFTSGTTGAQGNRGNVEEAHRRGRWLHLSPQLL